MTYQSKLEAAAEEASTEMYAIGDPNNGYEQDFQINAEKVKVFKKAIAWADNNPSPKVQRLLAAARNISPHGALCNWETNCGCNNSELHAVLNEWPVKGDV